MVTKLEKFQPTKIAVEMVPEDSKSYNEKYEQYKSGSYKLEMNEIFQIGFRLGVRLGHEQMYPVDWMGKSDLDYGGVVDWAEKNQPELLKEIYEGLVLPELTADKSILEYLKELNEPYLQKELHKMYVNLARIGDLNNYVGMNWLSWWYKRNLIMFANLTRLIRSEHERILFLVGCSHVEIVNNFLKESGMCDIVQPLSYLNETCP